MTSPARPLVVIYDGDCRFCRAFAHVARRAARPPGVRLVPFGLPEAEDALAVLAPDLRYTSVHAVRGRRLYSATDAFGVILAALRGGGLLLNTGLYRLYPLVVRNRHRIGKIVPDLPRPPID